MAVHDVAVTARSASKARCSRCELVCGGWHALSLRRACLPQPTPFEDSGRATQKQAFLNQAAPWDGRARRLALRVPVLASFLPAAGSGRTPMLSTLLLLAEQPAEQQSNSPIGMLLPFLF